jgi:periplasmic divalent cation tolerance protein
MITLFLTCADKKEADVIIKRLLEQSLIVCAKQLPVTSQFHWQGAIESSAEVLVIIESLQSKFDSIEAEVKKLHSYDTFVLFAVKAIRVSAQAQKWIEKELT